MEVMPHLVLVAHCLDILQILFQPFFIFIYGVLPVVDYFLVLVNVNTLALEQGLVRVAWCHGDVRCSILHITQHQ